MILVAGVIVASSVAHAQYADFQRGISLEDLHAGTMTKSSVAVAEDGSLAILASVEDRWDSAYLILWRLRADGSREWSRSWRLRVESPTIRSPFPTLSVAFAPDGGLILTGAYFGDLDLGGGKLVSAGNSDVFLAKLDAGGQHVWSRRFGGAGNDRANQALIDASGKITIVGLHAGVDFGGGLLSAPEHTTTCFRANFNADGSYLDSSSFGFSSGWVSINDMTVNDAGDVYIIGGSYLTVTIGEQTLENAGSADVIMAGFNAAGSVRFATHFGGEFFDTGHGIVQTAEGDLLTSGLIADKVSLGGPVIETSWIGGAYVARYSADGEHQWSRANESPEYGGSEFNTIALHPAGGIVVTGSFTSALQFDETSLFASSRSMLTMRFDDNGNFLWMGKGTPDGTALSVAAKPGGSTVVVGSNSSNLWFCTGEVIKTTRARGFVAEFSDAPHIDREAPNVPANARYDGTTVTWDASTDPEKAAVRYQVDEKIFPTSIEKRTTVEGNSMPLNATQTRNKFLYVRAYDCFDHMSEQTNRIEIRPWETAPLAPGNVHFEGTSLVWTTPTDADVVGVAVDGKTSWTSEPVRLGMTMTPGLDVENLSYRTYYVTAVDASGNWGDRVIVNDMIPPPPPTGFAYTLPKLTWEASKDVGFSYFLVYASKSPDFLNDKRRLVATSDNEFEVPVELRDAYYHIVQVDVAENSSAPVTVVGPGGARPARPRALAYRDGLLSWKTDDTDIDRFDVFASTTDASEGPRVLLGSSTELEFLVTEPGHAWYYVVAIDEAGQESDKTVVSAITGNAPSFVLSLGALTNPFRDATTLQYSLPNDGRVKIDLYDVRGARVATLVNGNQTRGSHYVDWSGTFENRGDAPSGVYFARLQFGHQERVAKLILLR